MPRIDKKGNTIRSEKPVVGAQKGLYGYLGSIRGPSALSSAWAIRNYL
ncbi:MAG: hypothetical protein ACFFB3_18975 [Candidatus Hodarchaeota archaeon]